MKAIVAFEVRVEEIENVFKLSQNRDEESYHNIINHLERGNPDENTIAAEMEKRQSQLFSK
jgi:transcriptional regulator